jgi:hypothetical protein
VYPQITANRLAAKPLASASPHWTQRVPTKQCKSPAPHGRLQHVSEAVVQCVIVQLRTGSTLPDSFEASQRRSSFPKHQEGTGYENNQQQMAKSVFRNASHAQLRPRWRAPAVRTRDVILDVFFADAPLPLPPLSAL